MKNLVIKIIKLANDLDKNHYYKQADIVTEILVKHAQAYQPQNFDEHPHQWPYSDVEEELEETDERRQNLPEFHPEYQRLNTDADDDDPNSIFDINGGAKNDAVPGVANVVYDPSSAGMNGLGNYTWDNVHSDDDGLSTNHYNQLPQK